MGLSPARPSGAAAATTIWRLRDAEGLRVAAFDDGLVAFDGATWETHLLDASAAIVLDALRARPHTRAELAAAVAARAGSDEGVDGFVDTLLAELVAAGLVAAGPVAAADVAAAR